MINVTSHAQRMPMAMCATVMGSAKMTMEKRSANVQVALLVVAATGTALEVAKLGAKWLAVVMAHVV